MSDNQQRVAKAKTQNARLWFERAAKDPIEHAIQGSFDVAYACKHPIKSISWLFGIGLSTLMVFSVFYGAFHLAFGKPGAVAFDWQKPTTWVAGGVDVVRKPVAGLLGATSDRLGNGGDAGGDGSGYDPESFED